MSDLLARFLGMWGLVGGLFILWIADKTHFYPLIFIGLAVIVAMAYKGE